MQVRFERLHVTLLCRFLADLLHLHSSITGSLDDAGDVAAAARSAGPGSAPTTATRAANVEQPAGRSSPQLGPGGSCDAAERLPCLVEIACTDLRLDVPRCSGSSEFVSMACASATAVVPAAAEYTEGLMPNVDR